MMGDRINIACWIAPDRSDSTPQVSMKVRTEKSKNLSDSNKDHPRQGTIKESK